MVKALYNEDNEKYFLKCMYIPMWGFPGGSAVKNLPANAETRVQSLGQEGALQKEKATQSRVLTWEISWTEEPGWIQSVGSQKSQL